MNWYLDEIMERRQTSRLTANPNLSDTIPVHEVTFSCYPCFVALHSPSYIKGDITENGRRYLQAAIIVSISKCYKLPNVLVGRKHQCCEDYIGFIMQFV